MLHDPAQMVHSIKYAASAAIALIAGVLCTSVYFSVFVVPGERRAERELVAMEASKRAMELISKGNEDATELNKAFSRDLCLELAYSLQLNDPGDGGSGICDDAAEAGNSAVSGR